MMIQERLNRVDEIRGFTLISMILYHFLWDLKNIAKFNIDWYAGPFGYVWQKSICICFIFISGFCFSLGRKRLKRSLEVFICGILVTAVTLIFMPQSRVVFGILTFIGTAGIITIFIDKLHSRLEKILDERTLNLTMVIGMLLLFIIFFNVNKRQLCLPYDIEFPKYMYKGYVATFLGLPDPHFFSSDYFAVMPWTFLYLAGYYTQRIICKFPNVIEFLKEGKSRFMTFIGKKSLIIYMLHQPVLYLITIIVSAVEEL